MHASFSSGDRQIRIEQAEPLTAEGHPAILLLHGAGGNTQFWFERVKPLANRMGSALYAPHYFDRTETSFADPATLSDGVHVPLWLETIDDALGYARRRPGVDPERIVLLGASLGAFLALAHAAADPRICAVVEISGGLVEPYATEAGPGFPPVLVVHGALDEVVPMAEAQALIGRLESLRVAHEKLILPAEGHYFSTLGQRRIMAAMDEFLKAHLLL